MKWQKRLSAILCALLVASSCFFQAFSTNAWADTNNSTTQDYFCTLFAVPSTYDPAHHGSPINIPNATTTGAWKSTSVANDWTGYFPLVVQSNVFQAVDHAVFIYVSLGVDADAFVEFQSTETRYSTLYYQNYMDGYNDPPLTVNNGVFYRAKVTTNKHGRAGLFRVQVPANCTEFQFNTPLKFRYKGAALVSCYGAWVVDPQHYDTFEQMIDILESIDAELDTQTEILNVVSTRLNSISDNVASIYDLLYDSLHDESSELSNESQAVAEQIMQQEDSEQYWSDKNTENYEAIGLDNFSFSQSIVSGFGVVGAIFQNIWTVMGDATVLYTFPLILGIALVVIGRVARSGGKGKGDHKDG